MSVYHRKWHITSQASWCQTSSFLIMSSPVWKSPFVWLSHGRWRAAYSLCTVSWVILGPAAIYLTSKLIIQLTKHFDDQNNQPAGGWSTLMFTWAFFTECYLLFLTDILKNKSFLLKYEEYWNKHIAVFYSVQDFSNVLCPSPKTIYFLLSHWTCSPHRAFSVAVLWSLLWEMTFWLVHFS